MPKIRLSGTVLGAEDPNRASRAKLLYLLFAKGWDIYNSNGDQRITLSNIEKKIIESDAFVFTPGATLEDMFKAISIFVGFQTLDRNLKGKPTIIMNEDASWNPFLSILAHLRKMGTVRQDYTEFLLSVDSPEAVLESLEQVRSNGHPEPGRPHIDVPRVTVNETPPPPEYLGNVCVFCSATLEESHYLNEGRTFGRWLAENKIGCISGAGRSGIMGAVVQGSVDAGGWAAGSNVPHIIELEGLPDGLARFWPRPDIYTRMEVMIEHSDAFVIFPGGAGTVQELLALMIFKNQKHPLMEGKPVVIFNRKNSDGSRFWDPLIAVLGRLCQAADFHVALELEHILPTIQPNLQNLQGRRASDLQESSVMLGL
jgi:uncharacterized protein (TIGR00730 family)